MAVSSVSSSSSIYGSRNVISGLASGMDTEAMIENAVSGYKLKINALTQKRTKVEWQQEAYRSIVTKMAAFTGKYADYQSSTNLMSPSFFNQAVKTIAQGANAAKVSASGKSKSDIQINAVQQLAKAATYRVSGSTMNPNMTVNDGIVSIQGDKSFDLGGSQTISSVSGQMTITYGSSNYLDIEFGEMENFDSIDDMVASINKQLESQSVTFTGGSTKDASEVLKASKSEDGKSIVFEDLTGNGNQIYISSATGKLKENLVTSVGKDVKSITVGDKALTEQRSTADYLATATLDITLDGQSKSVKIPSAQDIIDNIDWSKVDGGKDGATGKALQEKILSGKDITGAENRQLRDDAFVKALQKNIDDKFGKLSDGTSKLTVKDVNQDTAGGEQGIRLEFTAGQKGSSFSVGGKQAAALGLGSSGSTSYLDTGKTLKDLGILDGLEYTEDKDGKKLYSFEINGVKIGEYTEDTSIATIMSQINGNKEAGVNVSYSKTTNEFTFTAKETGVAGKIEFGGGLAQKLFGDSTGKVEAGQDAIFEATVNGTTMTLTRSSNTVDMDGMTVTLKGEFGYKTGDDGKLVRDTTAEAVSFSSSADADKIVDAIKSMVNDYNEMVTEIKKAYSTLPMQRSSGKYYEPLTEDDMDGMSDKAIENWNENAKAGILFGDRDLSELYSRLTDAISMAGADANDLRAAGITLNYSDGLTTLAFDENKLRATLETEPDRVTDIFTKNTDSGSSTKGFLQALKEPLDLYGKTTGVNLSTGTKGVLVNKAGHPLAASTMYSNTIQQQLDQIDQQISTWQDKMSDRVDYYTNKFSQLEQLIAQMNSQSSAISGLMGNG